MSRNEQPKRHLLLKRMNAWVRDHERHILAGAFIAFLGLSLWLFAHHEIWRDEAQAWLIARDLLPWQFIPQLTGYEGSFMLWHLLIAPFAQSGMPIISMRLLHLVLACIAAGLFLRAAPFSLFHRVLFIFGYYMLYEYNTIARSYVLTVLALFIVAILYARRLQRPYHYMGALLFLAGSTIFGTITALGFLITWMIEVIAQQIRQRRSPTNTRSVHPLLACGIVALGIVGLLVLLQEPADIAHYLRGWDWDVRFVDVLQVVINLSIGYTPLPYPSIHFWNLGLSPIQIPVGIVTFIASCALIRTWQLRSVFLWSTSGMLAIFLFKYPPSIRHMGMLFLVMIALLWMSESVAGMTTRRSRWHPYLLHGMLTIVLLIHVAGSGIALFFETRYPFSSSVAAADRVAATIDARPLSVIAYPSHITLAALALLQSQMRTFYSVEFQSPMSYMIWNTTLGESFDLSIAERDQRIDAWRRLHPEQRMLFITSEYASQLPLPANCRVMFREEETIAIDEPMSVCEFSPYDF